MEQPPSRVSKSDSRFSYPANGESAVLGVRSFDTESQLIQEATP